MLQQTACGSRFGERLEPASGLSPFFLLGSGSKRRFDPLNYFFLNCAYFFKKGKIRGRSEEKFGEGVRHVGTSERFTL